MIYDADEIFGNVEDEVYFDVTKYGYDILVAVLGDITIELQRNYGMNNCEIVDEVLSNCIEINN